MLRATSIVRRAAVKADKVADRVVLDHEARHKRRATLKGEGGLDVLLDLEKAAVLDDGDALKLEDGRLVLVQAAPQKLVEITAGSPERLLRLSWHIGNRHTAAEISEGAIYIEEDHVLVEMVRGLGAATKIVERPFRPERGAYHHETHAHDHSSHRHDHGHEHVHDEHCGHDHAHHHDH
jgi:urease accessory protein